VRYCDDTPGDLAWVRAAVAAWRDRNPVGTGEDLLAAIGHQFHQDYAIVLRAVLFAVDRHRARRSPAYPLRGDGRNRWAGRDEPPRAAAPP
jgi:hypothetical protein